MEYRPFFTLIVVLASNQLVSPATSPCPAGCQSCDNEIVRCPAAHRTSIPTSLPEDTNILDLSQNDITSLDDLPHLPNAQSMRMSQNQLTVITGGAFKHVPELMSLDLSMNKISKVYAKGFKGLNNLMSLSLTGNKLSTVGAMLAQCKSVTSLKLGNNEITNIEKDDFQHNTKIKMLDLSFNKIKGIHADAFKNLDMLRYLILRNNPLTTVQDLTFTSTILSLVDFTSCMLTAVPKTMPPSVSDFRLGNNKITKIHLNDFQNMTRLRIIFLNDNKISDVEHRSFSGLDNLKELWLSRNQLVYIPRGLPMNLEKLYIDNNHVVELEPMLFKNGSKLMKLSLESNNVRKVHQDSLKEVHDIDEVNLQGNEISLIDVGTFTKVPKLKVLKLSYNPVKVFENGAFKDLDSLSELYLSHLEYKMTGRDKLLDENILTSMPNLTKIDLTSTIHLTKRLFEMFEQADAPAMDTVKTVNLQYNELGTVPAAVKKVFPNVEHLILDGNPFICDKRLRWLNQWMDSSPSVNFHQTDELVCNLPLSLKGKMVSELRSDEFVEEVTDTSEQFQPPAQPDTVAQPSSNQQQPPVQPNIPAQPPAVSQPSQPSTNRQTNHGQQNQPSRQPSSSNQPSNTHSSSHYGTRVVIKPPSGSSKSPSSHHNKHKLTKAQRAARKAAKQAEKERKKRLKAERKKSRKRHHRGKGKARRKKRKVRGHGKNNKRCKVDENGAMQCVRRKRCKVDDQGNVVCRKRGGKKNKDKAAN